MLLHYLVKGLLLSLRAKKVFKSVNTWRSYKQERDCLMYFARLTNTLLKDEESAPRTTKCRGSASPSIVLRFYRELTNSGVTIVLGGQRQKH